jgi:hypothetical protein
MAAACLEVWGRRIEGKVFPDSKAAAGCEGEATHYIDEVVLMREERRKCNEGKPDHHQIARETAEMSGIGIDQEDEEGDMEGGKEIVRRIQAAEPIEKRTQPSLGARSRKSETERKGEEANTGERDRGRHAPPIDSQASLTPKKKRRRDKKEVDREVRQDERRHEGDGAFPGEIEDADIMAVRRDPKAAPVNHEEKQRQPARDGEGAESGR